MKQDLNVFYQVCVFRANRKNKIATLASDSLRHFRLLLWNRWTEFNDTWQEARSQCPLPCSCYSGWSKDSRTGLWLAETLWLLLWNCWTACNETWQEEKSQRPPSSLCLMGRSEKQDVRPGQSVKKVAHCTQVHDMWTFGPLVVFLTDTKHAIHVYMYHIYFMAILRVLM